MRATHDIESAIRLHADTVWRVTALYFKSEQDRQDAFQDAFLRYALSDKIFVDEEHRKAWLIRVTRNRCLDVLKSAAHRELLVDEETFAQVSATEQPDTHPTDTYHDVIDALRSLADPPRTPLYLSLVEEYPATDIAKMMDVPVNTVYSWVARGKKKLKEALR